MAEGLKEMAHWHSTSFSLVPVGDGYEIDATEFDWKDDGGVRYDRNGVTVRHWRRSHGMDGASAYRLDWNGLSFVWTGDGCPDELTVEMSKGVDVFLTEMQLDTPRIYSTKTGVPEATFALAVDDGATIHYGAGYLFTRIQPRLAMATHFERGVGIPGRLERAVVRVDR
jgi:ribonuclease Z